MHAFDVLGEPVRRTILELLSGGEHSSGEIVDLIQKEYGITQSAVSQHLRVLRDAGFASVRIDGARRLYTVESGPFKEIDGWLEMFRRFWEPRLDAFASEISRGRRK